jgi:hypothetical protein
MKVMHLAIGSLAAAFLAIAAEAAADSGTQCGVQYRHLVRVALSVAPGEAPVDTLSIARVVDQLWEPEGVDIDWIDEERAVTEERLDAWAVVGRTADELMQVPPREASLARRTVWISTDEVVARFEQRLSLQMQLPRESARHLLRTGQLMERLLGYALGHQLGHAVLGLSHAQSGLMSADYVPSPGASAIVIRDLDAENRRLLHKRFAIGCATR